MRGSGSEVGRKGEMDGWRARVRWGEAEMEGDKLKEEDVGKVKRGRAGQTTGPNMSPFETGRRNPSTSAGVCARV